MFPKEHIHLWEPPWSWWTPALEAEASKEQICQWFQERRWKPATDSHGQPLELPEWGRANWVGPLDWNADMDRDKVRRWSIYANREDRGGIETPGGTKLAGRWHARFRCLRTPALEWIDENWLLLDAKLRLHDIEAVEEVKGSNREWWIYATRRSADGRV